MDSYFKISQRRGIAFIPLVTALSIASLNFVAFTTADQGYFSVNMNERQVVGTLIMLSLLPAYLLLAIQLVARRVQNVLDHFSQFAETESYGRLQTRVGELRSFSYPVMLLFTVYGTYQNAVPIREILASPAVDLLDPAIVLGNCLLWLIIGALLSWHIPLSVALSKFGAQLEVDILETQTLRPIVRVATTDVLIVAGAMAFMPLQALDAEFRWVNYNSGAMVGGVSALLFFSLPLFGLRQNLASVKSRLVAQLEQELARIDRNDIQKLELHLSYISRIKGISTIPMDTQFITRLLASVIIPPLAWVGAAMVEQLITSG